MSVEVENKCPNNVDEIPIIKTIYTSIIWHEITIPPGKMPDEEKHVLIYDGYEDDVCIGYTESNSLGGHDWININSEWIIKNPQWWAEMPFPIVLDALPGIKI